MDDKWSERPNVARMYDYFLGGGHNFATDRQAAERVLAVYPDFPLVLRANRAFLRRAVASLARGGIDQFLDLGSGLPVLGAVHEVALAVNPEAHVVYVENDPIAVAHARTLLRPTPGAAMVEEDIRQAERLLLHPAVGGLLDLARPVAVVLGAVLHLISDDGEAYGLVRTLREAVAPGSYLVVTHGTWEATPPDVAQQVERLYAASTNPVTSRSHAQIVRFFDGFDVLPPGVVFLPRWHPESADDLFADRPERSSIYGGVGRKPVP